METERNSHEQPEQEYVTAAEIGRYLTDHSLPDIDTDKFPPEIRLSFFQEWINELYDAKKMGYVDPVEFRERKLQLQLKIEQQLNKNPNLTIEDLDEETVSLINPQAHVERACSLYINIEENTIGASEIIFGTYSEIEHNLLGIKPEGTLPFLLMHTHPIDSPPSPDDLGILVTQHLPNWRLRLIRGILVLSPNIQIFALPTAQSPLYSPNEWERILVDLNIPDKADLARYEQLKSRHLELVDRSGETLRTYLEILSFKQDQVRSTPTLTHQESEASEKEIADHYLRMYKRVGEKYTRAILRTYINLMGAARIADQRYSLSACFRMNLKLYISTDRINFKEFTA